MRTLEISEETYEKIKSQLATDELEEVNSYEDMIGKNWFIQTATFHYTGTVVGVKGKLLKLENCAWQAYQPRLKNFLDDGELDEVEPIGDYFINVDWIVGIAPYKYNIKMSQK